MKLKDLIVKNAKPKEKMYRLFDGDGLYLEVLPTGGKYWRIKYRYAGKEKRLAFGVYPEVSLSEARECREKAKKALAAGNDPGELKKEAKRQLLINSENSFEVLAREWHKNRLLRWTDGYAKKLMTSLEQDVFPKIGKRPIVDISAPELLSMLKIIEGRGALETARRVKQTCGQVFMFAIAGGRAERNPAADLALALQVPKKKSYAHLKESELPGFLAKLEAYDGHIQTKLALRLLMLTFVRTVELRGATWDEINFDKAEWRIPAERMKMRVQHIVPLSEKALEVLEELRRLNGHWTYVFPNLHKPAKCMSENTILFALYRMGYHSRATGHGFRSTASTILNENDFHKDAIERQLAHAERDKVRGSYNYAEYLPERRKMMQWWADYLAIQASKK